jgi:hypothetical protein
MMTLGQVLLEALEAGKCVKFLPNPSPGEFVLDVHVGFAQDNTVIASVREFDELELVGVTALCLQESLKLRKAPF